MTDPAPAAEKAEAAEKLEKRNRPPVSCEPCRQRKLKCNRGLPCDTCIRRNKQGVCQYASNARRGKPNIPSKQAQLQDKLKNLESLVSSLVTKQERPTSPAGPQSTSPFGSLDLSNRPSPAPSNKESPRPILAQNGQVSYVDPSHWQSVLEELKEVREQLSSTGHSLPSEPAPNPQSGMGGSDVFFLFADSGEADLEDILASIPSQAVCDGLLSNYFNAPVTLLPIVHPEKFRMEYQDFWASPSDVNPLWLGMLFSILALSISLRQLSKGPDDSLPSPVFMQQRTVHCLVLGNYVSASAYSLEAIILHMQSCFLTSRDTQSQLWLKMGHAIQLAFRMAYHRDPSKLPGISAFDGEMRRRVWMNLIQLDALGSFQIGLPSMVPNDYCDTRVPGNYEYTDLYPAMTSLPPPRPLNQRTPMLYTISKAHIMAIFKKITQHTQTLAETTYERTIALDLEMREAYATHIPQLLQRRAVNQSYMDATSLIWDRANIELLYLKGIIVLHRRYLRHEPGNPRFEPSRRHCVDAALETLARQADIGRASQPGGRLHEDRWMSGALAVYDFILAAMVVCLDLSMRMKSPAQPTSSDDIAAKELAALQVSQGIWSATVQASRSPEAVVAAKTIDLMLKSMEQRQQRGGNGKQEVSPTRAHQQQQQQQQQQGVRPPQAQSQYPHHMQQFHQQMFQQQQQAYNHPHMQQQQQPAQGPPPAYTAHGQTQIMPELPHTQQQQQQQGQQPLLTYAEPMFSDMIDGSEPLDWSLLDQFFQNPSASAAGGGEGWEAVIGMGSASGGSGFDDLDM